MTTFFVLDATYIVMVMFAKSFDANTWCPQPIVGYECIAVIGAGQPLQHDGVVKASYLAWVGPVYLA